jgi:hypothetical protein
VKRTCIFQFASSSIHLAASLEILAKKNQNNSDIYFCFWGNQTLLPNKMAKTAASPFGSTPRKILSLIKAANPYAIVSTKLCFNGDWVNAILVQFQAQLNKISDLSELHKLCVDQIKPGAALANEIINRTRDRYVNLSEITELTLNLLKSYLTVYAGTKDFLIQNEITEVYVYNGRFLHERAVWDAARDLKKEVFIFETLRNRFQIRTEGFHDRLNNQKVMKDIWSESDLPLKDKIAEGSTWFNDMSSKKNKYNIGTDFDLINEKDFIVYYVSSDEEMFGFWDQWAEPLGTQYECILKLIDIFNEQSEFDLFIKLHPNLLNKSDSVMKKMMSIPLKSNSRIIMPDSDISTYDLLNKSTGTITIGSTIGIESAFHLRPVLMLADTKYDDIGVGLKASNWSEVKEWIKNVKSIPIYQLEIIKSNACIFGFYYAKAGQDFLHTSLMETSIPGAWEATEFKNIKISENRFLIIFRKIFSKFAISVFFFKSGDK